MLTTHQLLNGLPADETLRFFVTFARFEFAMKQCGFLRRTQHNRVAEACREKLSANLPGDFFEAVRDAQIAPILIQRPPKNLFVQAGARPKFGNELPELSNTRQLLDAVWQVRNNLFHGNKLYPANRDRDMALMDNALAVIDAIMQRDRDLSSAFHDPQQFF